VAEGQDLLPIGSRLTQEVGDKAIKTRLIQESRRASEASQAVVEAQAAQAELLDRLQSVNAELERGHDVGLDGTHTPASRQLHCQEQPVNLAPSDMEDAIPL